MIKMKKLIILLTLIFLAGWLSSSVISSKNIQNPIFLSSNLEERESPQDYIKEDQIEVYRDRVIINIPGVSWAKYEDTNSMDPLIDKEANGLEIIPKCENIVVGDVIVYETSLTDGLIVHRVIEKSVDETGLYFRLKGDNSPTIDPEKIRCSQIKYQLIGVLY